MKKIILLFLYFIEISVFSQNLILDSLYQVHQNKKLNYTSKILLLNEIAFELRYILPDSSLKILNENIKKAKKINFIDGVAGAEYIFAIHKVNKSDYAEGIKMYFKCLETFEKTKNNRQIARVLNNIGVIYYFQKKYDKAEDFLKKALKINENIKNYPEIIRCYNNLGRIYFEQNKFTIAFTYAQKILDVIEKKQVKGDFAIYYCNVAEYSMKLGKDKTRLRICRKNNRSRKKY